MHITVFLMFNLVFAGNHHAASTIEESAKRLRLIFCFMPRSSSLSQNLLHFVKKFLCNDWVVPASMHFFGVAKMSVVKGVGQKIFHSVFMPYLAASSHYSLLRQKVRYILQSFVALGVKFKSGFSDFGFLPVHNNHLYSGVIEIADWRRSRIFSPPHFLAQSSTDIFAQRINVVFALPEGDVEHKFSLRGVFCPKSRELQHRQMPAIQKINNAPAINRIARQSVRVLTDNAVRFPALYAVEHIVKNRATRNFRGLFFNQFLDYV
ncbi:MAG: hypothetical protein A3G59_03045 [Candidatus Taylorbacteria bacterium RIFCSPLOWO2_12_FULL_47_20]|uniref:Uncharacterized protein n=2 Tax=Candidatus Tayloriibacteriota TaxID=1817919 RepID=A0A1G2PA28_9BACT|nr:MAG: hypothetical protein A3H68_01320 [Candidatus Taylorbacteria bacterium RIFCSPLOWO2_02_FULL_46_40]OHA45184.1 MAG: hypothetical protein A3G59_03045 [Candidatus Taylorbacteria bacterium RIFCSPLOWO2_12_FULL_47_20]